VASRSAAARRRSGPEASAMESGSSARSQDGSGRDPSTVSTAIFSGSGVSRATGVDRSCRARMPRIESQYGRA
jgi:hypothetical protein